MQVGEQGGSAVNRGCRQVDRPSKWPRRVMCLHEEKMEPGSKQMKRGCGLDDAKILGFGHSSLGPKRNNNKKDST